MRRENGKRREAEREELGRGEGGNDAKLAKIDFNNADPS